jgi:hypothetical protein
VPHTPLPSAMRTQAGRPGRGRHQFACRRRNRSRPS